MEHEVKVGRLLEVLLGHIDMIGWLTGIHGDCYCSCRFHLDCYYMQCCHIASAEVPVPLEDIPVGYTYIGDPDMVIDRATSCWETLDKHTADDADSVALVAEN